MRAKMIIAGLCFFLVMSTIACIKLPYLVTALRALGQEEEARGRYSTVFQDDFDQQDPNWHWWQEGHGSVEIAAGYGLLKLKGISTGGGGLDNAALEDHRSGRGNQWLFVSMEVRLRCSDDNKQESDKGGGMRSWGFVDSVMGFPENGLGYVSLSPGSDPSLAGFWAMVSINDSVVFMEPMRDVNMTMWHNYTISWEPGNVTFLIDGDKVATTNQVPDVPLAMMVFAGNGHYQWDGENIEWKEPAALEHDVWIQTDHLRVFMDQEWAERYAKDANITLYAAHHMIEAAGERGMNITSIREHHANATKALSIDGYIHAELHRRMMTVTESLPDYLDELSQLFTQASEIIQTLESEGKDARVVKAQYQRASEAWENCEYTNAISLLERIAQTYSSRDTQ